MLLPFYQNKFIEAGCDEAGRGCLAGPVFAAAVILPKNFRNENLNDSKKLSRKQREELRSVIENEAVGFAVASLNNNRIDEINILNASIQCMHDALSKLQTKFEFIIVDGNKFKPYADIPYQTIIQGDGKYMSIAAASILAKTYRDDFMEREHEKYPQYDWRSNKGYATQKHRTAVLKFGNSPLHRKTFILKELQQELW